MLKWLPNFATSAILWVAQVTFWISTKQRSLPFYCETNQVASWWHKWTPEKGLGIPEFALKMSQPSRTVCLISIYDRKGQCHKHQWNKQICGTLERKFHQSTQKLWSCCNFSNNYNMTPKPHHTGQNITWFIINRFGIFIFNFLWFAKAMMTIVFDKIPTVPSNICRIATVP